MSGKNLVWLGLTLCACLPSDTTDAPIDASSDGADTSSEGSTSSDADDEDAEGEGSGSSDGDGPGCGDGIVQAGEFCDDANIEDDDACDSSCAPTSLVPAWLDDIEITEVGSGLIAIAASTDGSVVVAGGRQRDQVDRPWLRKYDVDGRIVWDLELESEEGYSATALAFDGAGDLFVAMFPAAFSDSASKLVKLDPEGNTLWSSELQRSGSPSPFAVDASGDAIVVGIGDTGSMTGHPVWFSKLDGASGQTLWTNIVDQAPSNDVRPTAVTATDAARSWWET